MDVLLGKVLKCPTQSTFQISVLSGGLGKRWSEILFAVDHHVAENNDEVAIQFCRILLAMHPAQEDSTVMIGHHLQNIQVLQQLIEKDSRSTRTFCVSGVKPEETQQMDKLSKQYLPLSTKILLFHVL